MADYTKKTRQGYEIKQCYMYKYDSDSSTTILAVIKRSNDYLWAWAYHLEDGTWGQGHYDYPTFEKAVRSLKSEYPSAKPINPNTVLSVICDYDGFGKYTDLESALKRAYYLAKARRETMYIKHLARNLRTTKIEYDWDKKIAYATDLISGNVYRLYADGHVVRI